jgi:AraC-like DNA-binding protein
MLKKLNEVYQTTVFERDEHKASQEYKKLSPKMRKAVDSIFKIMDTKPSDFLNTFEKTIREVSKKFGVTEKELMRYFEKEMLST